MTLPERRKRTSETGLLSTELAVLMPVLLLFALLAVYVVHVERHTSRAQQAADAAARAASLVVGESQAEDAAQVAAAAVCNGTAVISDWDFEAPVFSTFTPGRVSLSVDCSEPFDTFEPLVRNQVRTATGSAVSAIEYWRTDS